MDGRMRVPGLPHLYYRGGQWWVELPPMLDFDAQHDTRAVMWAWTQPTTSERWTVLAEYGPSNPSDAGADAELSTRAVHRRALTARRV